MDPSISRGRRLLRSYLWVRHSHVKYESATSKNFSVLSGVPQGSVLDPTFYLIYMADIPTLPIVFANEIVILTSHRNVDTAAARIQHHLHLMEEWYSKRRIRANGDKSTNVSFTLTLLTLYDQAIPKEDGVKYLKIGSSARRLTWTQHKSQANWTYWEKNVLG